MPVQWSLNTLFDGLPRPTLGAFGREVPTFRTCGIAGFYLSVLVLVSGGLVTGRSGGVLALLAVISAWSFFAYTHLRKWITGREQLVLLEHVWFAFACNALTLRWIGAPVLPYLDLVSVALCPFLAAGRVGCTLVGCCHGRPSAVGITYTEDCARQGFARHLVGVRLFPVPAIEAAGLLVLGLIGWVALPRAQPGTVFGWYLISYAVMRFGLEGLRGDERPHLLGLSQARWMSIGEVAFALALDAHGRGPASPLIIGALAIAAIVVVFHSWRQDLRRQLLASAHVREIRDFLGSVTRTTPMPSDPETRTTSRHLTVAASSGGSGQPAAHVSLSFTKGPGSLELLCELATAACPSLLSATGRFTESRVLHVIVPCPLPDEEPDPRLARDQFNALYGHLVRRLQQRGPKAAVDPLSPSAIWRWHEFLEGLERDAAREDSAETWRSGPSGNAIVSLLIDQAGEGQEVHSYSVRAEDGPLSNAFATALGGVILERLPSHRILRAGFCDSGVFHLWLLVPTQRVDGISRVTAPSTVQRRAASFSEVVRSVASANLLDERVDREEPEFASMDYAPVATTVPDWYFRNPAGD